MPKAMSKREKALKELESKLAASQAQLDFAQSMVKKHEPEAYKWFCSQLSQVVATPKKPKGKGRPPSKVSSPGYFHQRFLDKFDNNMVFCVEALMQKNDVEIGQLKPGNRIAGTDFFSVWKKHLGSGNRTSSPSNSGEKAAFNSGAVFSLTLARSIVLEIILRNLDDLWDITKSVKTVLEEHQRVRPLMKAFGLSAEAIKEFEAQAMKDLPNDILRKVRTPAVSGKQISKFMLTVKETNGVSYLRDVAKKLKLTEVEVMGLYSEARRQKKGISLEKSAKGGPFFLVS